MQSLMDRIKTNLLSDYRILSGLMSILFGSVVILFYYTIQWIIPRSFELYNEIVAITFIVVSVLILFPARNRFIKKVFRRIDYSDFFGDSLHHFDFIGRQFHMNVMIDEIFPQLMNWLRVPSGRISIYDTERKDYILYIYKNGHLVKRRSSHFQKFKQLTDYMRIKKRPLLATDMDLPEHISTFMEKFRAVEIHPFFYRRNPVGFLMLHSSPRHKYAERALDLFARKAAVSIHNHFLSNKIVDSHLYDREFKEAIKIRKFLQRTRIPKIEGYTIQAKDTSGILSVAEFIPCETDRWLIVIISYPRISSAAGIALSGLIGRLYSFSKLNEKITLHGVLNILRIEMDRIPEEYRLSYFLGEFFPSTGKLTVMPDSNFIVRDSEDLSTELSVHGWRNTFYISETGGCTFFHRDTPIVEISIENTAEKHTPKEEKKS